MYLSELELVLIHKKNYSIQLEKEQFEILHSQLFFHIFLKHLTYHPLCWIHVLLSTFIQSKRQVQNIENTVMMTPALMYPSGYLI